jgi:glycerol-3-phosphate dehydrogenase
MTIMFDRGEALSRLASETFDVLVVGGGVTGCGVALDAAARGLSTALVEAADISSGTSSKSSKLIHGGLRYLQQQDYLLVYEALHERQILLGNAPHLVHPLPFLIPLFGKDGVASRSVAKAYQSALWLYDITGGIRIGKRHRRITSEEALAHFPVLRSETLVASFLYWDAQADDARLTLALARTAASLGACVANYSPVAELIEEGSKVCGARLGDGTLVKARHVINAGGVWSAQVASAGIGQRSGFSLRPAKGIHVTVRASRLPCDYASVISVPGDRRSVFVVPWAADEALSPSQEGRYTYVGTTDTDYDGPLDDPQCTPEDIDYVLGAVNAWTSANLTIRDVTASWAGLRPLVSDASSARTADLSRRHKVIVAANGLVTVTGGKLTTYRKMAADAVDALADRPETGSQRLSRFTSDPRVRRARRRLEAVASRQRPAGGGAAEAALAASRTKHLPLIGAANSGRPDRGAAGKARSLGISDADFKHLSGRHGSETAGVLALCDARPELAHRLHPNLPYLAVEVVWAAQEEMARGVDDVLSRRTRARILDRQAAVECSQHVAELLGEALGWDAEEVHRQSAEFKASVAAELRAEGVTSDVVEASKQP